MIADDGVIASHGPIAGLNAVLAAVKPVLASGRLSADPIPNVVVRLTGREAPPSVETHLQLNVPCCRYCAL